MRNNLRLYYARWLAQHGLYDQSVRRARRLKLAEIAGTSLLFYRMVAHHQLVEPDDLPRCAHSIDGTERPSAATISTGGPTGRARPRRARRRIADHIARRMNDAAGWSMAGPGDKVQMVEKKVSRFPLDKKIDKLEKEQQQQQQQQQQSQQGGQAQPSQPMQDSQLPGMKSPMKVDQAATSATPPAGAICRC